MRILGASALLLSSSAMAQQSPPQPCESCRVTVTAPKPTPVSPPRFGGIPPVRVVPNSPDITLPDIGSDICEQIENDAPYEADKFCKTEYNRQQRAQALVQRLFREAATSSDRGPNSSFGLLHRFLETPQSRLPAAGRSSAAEQIVVIVGNALEQLRANNSSAVNWEQISVQITQACFTTEIALTGRAINPWPLHESTRLCIAGGAVLLMEARGIPYNPDANRTWLDGVAVGPGIASVDLGNIVTGVLNELGFKDGLVDGSALNALGDFVEKSLKACERYLKRKDENGCSAP